MAQKAYQLAFAGNAVDDAFYSDVVALRVEESTWAAGSFQLQLATRLSDDGSWSYLDDDRLALFTKVTIKLGFSGGGGIAGALSAVNGIAGSGGNDGLISVFDGYITAVSFEAGSQPGDSRVDVVGMDTSVLMSLEEKIATWKDLSDSDIVQQIVSVYGVAIQADPTATVHQEDDTTIVQRGSDIQFVRELARRNGLEFYFESDPESGEPTAYFRAPQLEGTPQPDLAIQFGGESNLRRFSVRVNGQRPLATKVAQIDVTANSPNIAQVSDSQLSKLGDKDANTLIGGPLDSLVAPKDAVGQMLVLGPPTSDATELQTIAQAVRDEAGWFISAHGEINGEAYQNVLRPRRIVLVKGAGKPHSGKYYVTQVLHEIKGDGSYTQTFDARRNARDVDQTEQFGASTLGVAIPGM